MQQQRRYNPLCSEDVTARGYGCQWRPTSKTYAVSTSAQSKRHYKKRVTDNSVKLACRDLRSALLVQKGRDNQDCQQLLRIDKDAEIQGAKKEIQGTQPDEIQYRTTRSYHSPNSHSPTVTIRSQLQLICLCIHKYIVF